MKAGLAKLSTKELATLAEQAINAAKQSHLEEVKAHPFLIQLEEVYAEYVSVLSKSTYSGKGKSVALSDKQRNVAFRALRLVVEAYTLLENNPKAKDAQELLSIIKNYGLNLNKLSYSEQTAQLNKLIENFEKPENISKLNQISATLFFDALKEAQNNFKTLFDEQVIANAKLRKQKNASILRKDLEKNLKRFLDYVTLMMDIAQWKPFYNQLNEYVKAAKKTNSSKNDTIASAAEQ